MQVLRDIGLGRQISQDLQKSGATKDQADSMASYISKFMVAKISGHVFHEALDKGVDPTMAGAHLAAKQADEDAARAYHEGGFSDLSGFYQKPQSAASNNDEYDRMTAENTRATAEASRAMLEQLQGKVPPAQAPPVVAQGPARFFNNVANHTHRCLPFNLLSNQDIQLQKSQPQG